MNEYYYFFPHFTDVTLKSYVDERKVPPIVLRNQHEQVLSLGWSLRVCFHPAEGARVDELPRERSENEASR